MKYCCLSCSVELVMLSSAPFSLKTFTQVALTQATVIKRDTCSRCKKELDLITEFEDGCAVWSEPSRCCRGGEEVTEGMCEEEKALHVAATVLRTLGISIPSDIRIIGCLEACIRMMKGKGMNHNESIEGLIFTLNAMREAAVAAAVAGVVKK